MQRLHNRKRRQGEEEETGELNEREEVYVKVEGTTKKVKVRIPANKANAKAKGKHVYMLWWVGQQN
jgi:hypothetical protein